MPAEAMLPEIGPEALVDCCLGPVTDLAKFLSIGADTVEKWLEPLVLTPEAGTEFL